MKLKIFTILAASLFIFNSCSVDDNALEVENIDSKAIDKNLTERQAPPSLNSVTNDYSEVLSCDNANLTFSEKYYESEQTTNNGQTFINSNHSYSVLLSWNIDVTLDNNKLFYMEVRDPTTNTPITAPQPLPTNAQVLISHLNYQWPSFIFPYEIINNKEIEYRFVYRSYDPISGQLCISETDWKLFNLIQ